VTAARHTSVHRVHWRRGALLLEIILALAIFVMAGSAILALVDRTVSGVQKTRGVAKAADLARSTMARIEAGIGTVQTLNGPVRAWPESDDGRAEDDESDDGMIDSGGIAPPESGWELQIDTEPSEFTGLAKITIRAFKRAAPDSDQVAAEYTLRQLVRLSGKGEDRAGGEDALAAEAKRGLSESRSGPSARERPSPGSRP
jgi:hypothetical protein